MSTRKLSNIPIQDFRKFLENQGLKLITDSKGRGGHEKWSRADIDRPITIKTHIDPVPEFIVKQVLRHLKMSREKFFKEFYE
nr:type II toxin-antitoxin system HicA family toxin [Bacteroidota bacterium]